MTKIYVKAWGSVDRQNCEQELISEEDGISLLRLVEVDKFIDPKWQQSIRRAGRFSKLMLAAASECFRSSLVPLTEPGLNRAVFLATATGESGDAQAMNHAIRNPDSHIISPTHFVSIVSQMAILALADKLKTTRDVYALAMQRGGLAASLRLAARGISTGRLDEAWVGVGEICTPSAIEHSTRVSFSGSNEITSYHEGAAWIVLSKHGDEYNVTLEMTASNQTTQPDLSKSYCPSDDATTLSRWLSDSQSANSWCLHGSGMEFQFKKTLLASAKTIR
ncbi:MAG: hypothetical protein NTV34_14780 [Proteobacteria bacterium]|nr:hypothetical protein [Pseudomonadota bacterium]